MAPTDNIPELRLEIDRLISAGRVSDAGTAIAALWRQDPTPASAAFILARSDRAEVRSQLNYLPFRVAILRSFTIEPAIPLLRATALCHRLDLCVHIGDYNAYMQEVVDPESALYRFEPNAVILAARTADLAPDLWQDYSALDSAAVHAATGRVVNTLQQFIVSFRRHSQAPLIIHTLEQPLRPALGVLDSQSEISQSEAIQNINRELRQTARQHRDVYILDYDALIARYGRLLWQDERKYLTVRLPITAHHLIHLADEWLRLLLPLSARTAKAIVVDLDNTLWGGIIGEDGMAGIKLGAEYPGAAYQSLQRALLDLSRKGILLAICSKNNFDDAMEVLEKHPGMLLRPSHFAAIRINWNDKSRNLPEIAAELNIGVDCLAFLDDNPFEREQVRSTLPEVLVVDLPADPIHYAAAVRDCPAFERLTLSAEDAQRTAFYAQNRERSQVEQTFKSKEDFFHYLQQEAVISPVSSQTLARVSQLTQKTNQFNLTTTRLGEQQIADLAARPGSHVFTIHVRDRFGDHGLVGVAIASDHDDTREIDTFLLSCRVIGRSVETALLSHLAQDAAAHGLHRLAGWFIPTRKNAPAKDFYSQHGFEHQENKGDNSRWSFDLRSGEIVCPAWIKLNVANGGPA
jgi:FkbH-like protein